jgi:hypothetical protein
MECLRARLLPLAPQARRVPADGARARQARPPPLATWPRARWRARTPRPRRATRRRPSPPRSPARGGAHSAGRSRALDYRGRAGSRTSPGHQQPTALLPAARPARPALPASRRVLRPRAGRPSPMSRAGALALTSTAPAAAPRAPPRHCRPACSGGLAEQPPASRASAAPSPPSKRLKPCCCCRLQGCCSAAVLLLLLQDCSWRRQRRRRRRRRRCLVVAARLLPLLLRRCSCAGCCLLRRCSRCRCGCGCGGG